MEKHTNIPTAATWNAADNQWELGEKNSAGKEIGIWNNWHVEGHLCGTVDYRDGNPPFILKRFHPDGSLAQEGNWYGGQKWLGTYSWIKSENPTSEPFPAGPAEKNPMVWIAEFDYSEEGVYNAQRYFNKQKQPISSEGEALPIRPATVPERAHYINKRWIMGQVDTRKGKYTGDYAEWDLNGIIIVKRVYDPETSEVVEEYKYENGKINTSKVYAASELLQSFYHRNVDPPVVKNSILYRNDSNDRTQTFFDETGRELYSVRLEKVSDHHERRYYNGVLVYEGIGNPDHAKAPSSVKYYYAGGATLIDYTSNGDGTGIWRLYDEAGQELLHMPENDEEEKNEYNHWDTFMPSWGDYKYETTRVDWDAVIENFKAAHSYEITKEKLYALVAPEHLKQELEKVDWENIETAMGGGKKLPIAITGLFTEDEDVIEMGLDRIWYEILHQGSICEATYKVATILARMFPYHTNVPPIQSRLIRFLFKVLGQSYLTENQELYNEMITALNAIAPLVIQIAGDVDEPTALRAQYILVHGGRNMPETEALFIRERQRTANSLLRRAYATFSLGSLYLYTKQQETLVTHFSAAFLTEPDKLVRMVMAVYLVFATKQDAQDTWLAELIGALSDPDSVSDDFYSLQPFIRGCDVQEYVVMILGHGKQEVLESNMEGVINALLNANSMKQVMLFKAIFAILFSNESALSDITPIRKKALLAAAAVIDAHPNFVNHSEVFRDYNVPYDSYKLRQLATASSEN
ncbi:MAG TPA: hypothetical protein VF008_05100 [Niastella sp.]